MTYLTVLIHDCSCALLAGDTLVYQEIASFSDCSRLQRNLDSRGAWSDKWDMSFNISKSKIISFNCGNDTPNSQLYIEWISAKSC